MRSDQSIDIVLTGAESRDVIVGRLPSVPDRLRLVTAWGRVLDDEQADDSHYLDIGALCAAAIGVCWPDRRLGVTLRECRRDVIEYGERVVTGLWGLGYRDAEEITRVGQGLLTAAVQDLEDEQAAIADAAEDFGGAQP